MDSVSREPESSDDIREWAQAIWDYLRIENRCQSSGVAFVFGRDDLAIANRAFDLYNEHCAEVLLLLGGRGRLSGNLGASESGTFFSFLRSKGVPTSAMMCESMSTNTGENVSEGLELLSKYHLTPRTAIVVTHGPHSRRALAAARLQAPAIRFASCPDECVLPSNNSPEYYWALKELVGEVERLIRYSEVGYIEPEEVPGDVRRLSVLVRRWLESRGVVVGDLDTADTAVKSGGEPLNP